MIDHGIWEAAGNLITVLNGQGKVNWHSGFTDGTLASVKKGGDRVGPINRSEFMLLIDDAGLPLAIDIDSASPPESLSSSRCSTRPPASMCPTA